MNLKKIKTIIDAWVISGLLAQCWNCGQDISFEPEDDFTTCENCESNILLMDAAVNKLRCLDTDNQNPF